MAVAATEAVVGQKVMAEVEVEAVEAVEAVAAAMAAELGAGAGSAEAAGRRPTRESHEHGLHAPLPWCAPLPSVGLGPYLFLGLLLSCAATRRPRLRGYDESNSNPSRVSRTGIGPKRRWLILSGLAVASGFRLPEDNGGVTQIGADIKFDPLPLDGTSTTGRRGLASSTDYTGGARVSDIVGPGQVGRCKALALAAAGRCRTPETCGCGCSRA